MKKALITGITGQDGAYLSQFLLGKGYDVYGLVRRLSTLNFWRLDELGIRDKIHFLEGDLMDATALNSIMESLRPAEIYNLAAQSFVGTSWQQSILTTEVNTLGTVHLLNAMKHHHPEGRFYQASTSEMYGNSNIDNIQDERTSLHPRSPYAISKLAAHWFTINYRESYGLFACSGILFNHESPLRGIEFVTRKITDGVARIKLGLAKDIRLGNLDARRDWGFAGDYVEAMWLMLQQPKPDDFVVSTGENRSVRDFLTAAFREIDIGDWTPYVQQDPAMLRPSEVHELCGKSDKARKVLGWKPKVSFEALVKMMVEADLRRLQK
ncbi:MAG: GDP-mannose 4,6-dehydratase [Patescibacteria group bacterium]